MDNGTLSLQQTLNKLPPSQDSSLAFISELLSATDTCTVVLDDDPTGTQTVTNVAVLTTWDTASLTSELDRRTPLFYVLTNSRALTVDAATQLADEIGRNLSEAARATGRQVRVISRSDSTLRGHFPAEVDALTDSLGQPDAIRVLCPFFLEGGRFTIGDVHYAAEKTDDGDELVPCAQTPFAQDAAFGYHHSNLIDWTIEKCEGRIARESIHSVSIEDLRSHSAHMIAKRFADLPPQSVVVVNAASLEDVEKFAAVALEAELSGQRFVYRTAAGFVRAMAGQSAQPFLDRASCLMDTAPKSARGGLIVVGSYVPKTTAQWERLVQDASDLVVRTIDVEDALTANSSLIAQATAAEISRSLRVGKHVAICTTRQLRASADAEKSLDAGRQISRHLVEIVRSIDAELEWLIAKGGITSSDVATEALSCRRATVIGQITAGIPVWRLGDESRRPGLPYVVFPGNVGSETTLRDVFEKLR